jgi:Ubiquitin carboxyl-terminal hydrolase, family 1
MFYKCYRLVTHALADYNVLSHQHCKLHVLTLHTHTHMQSLQVIPNACATQAILSVLLNAGDKLQLGSTLSDFLSFTRDFPPDLKGLAISNSDQIRTVHNGFSRQDPFVHEKSDEQEEDKEAYHFIAYLPHKGKVSMLYTLIRRYRACVAI